MLTNVARPLKIPDTNSPNPTSQLLLNRVKSGWPRNKPNIYSCLFPFWTFRDEITHVDGLLFKGIRLIVQKSMHQRILDIVYESHLGIVNTRAEYVNVYTGPAW